jgi:hypothetical protein
MRRCIAVSVFLTVFFASSLSSFAATTVDIVNYMGLKAGKWSIFTKPGSGTLEGFTTVKGANGQILRKYYEKSGNVWTWDSSEIFKITPTTVQLVGSIEGPDTWNLEPAFVFPRLLNLNKPVRYNGVMRNQRTNATQPIMLVLCVTQQGLTVNTTAGTFTNCIKVWSFQYTPGQLREGVELWAPGRERVKSWVSKIKDTPSPVVETQTASSKVLVQFGDSAPPLP